MNYIGCFNRSRAANCLQPVFFRSWCASMLPGVEYCRRAICAFLVCLDAARRGVLSVAPFCAVLVPRCCQVWSVARCTVAPFLVRLNGAHFVTLYIL